MDENRDRASACASEIAEETEPGGADTGDAADIEFQKSPSVEACTRVLNSQNCRRTKIRRGRSPVSDISIGNRHKDHGPETIVQLREIQRRWCHRGAQRIINAVRQGGGAAGRSSS